MGYLEPITCNIGVWQHLFTPRKITPITSNMVLRQLQTLYNDCLEHDRKVLRLSFQGKFEEAEVELRKRDRILAKIKSMNTLRMTEPQYKAEYEELERKRSMLIG
jgi:hypothetical protein